MKTLIGKTSAGIFRKPENGFDFLKGLNIFASCCRSYSMLCLWLSWVLSDFALCHHMMWEEVMSHESSNKSLNKISFSAL